MKSLILTYVALALLAGGMQATAQDKPAPSRAQEEQAAALEATRKGEIMSYAKVRQIAEKKLKAKVIGERLRRTNNGWVYEFRARNKKGRIIHAIFSAKTGKLIARR